MIYEQRSHSKAFVSFFAISFSLDKYIVLMEDAPGKMIGKHIPGPVPAMYGFVVEPLSGHCGYCFAHYEWLRMAVVMWSTREKILCEINLFYDSKKAIMRNSQNIKVGMGLLYSAC